MHTRWLASTAARNLPEKHAPLSVFSIAGRKQTDKQTDGQAKSHKRSLLKQCTLKCIDDKEQANEFVALVALSGAASAQHYSPAAKRQRQQQQGLILPRVQHPIV